MHARCTGLDSKLSGSSKNSISALVCTHDGVLIYRPHMLANKMKSKLAAGQPEFDVSVMIPSPQIVEMVGEQDLRAHLE